MGASMSGSGDAERKAKSLTAMATKMKKFAVQVVRATAFGIANDAKKTFVGNVATDSPGPFGLRPHVRTGRLRSSINARMETADSKVSATVGTNVEYAKFVEFGTKPHIIRPRGAGALAFEPRHATNIWTGKASRAGAARKGRVVSTNIWSGKQTRAHGVVVKSVNHPGSRPHPFLLPNAIVRVRAMKVVLSRGISAIASGKEPTEQ